jgi:hypothetical protein
VTVTQGGAFNFNNAGCWQALAVCFEHCCCSLRHRPCACCMLGWQRSRAPRWRAPRRPAAYARASINEDHEPHTTVLHIQRTPHTLYPAPRTPASTSTQCAVRSALRAPGSPATSYQQHAAGGSGEWHKRQETGAE